MQFNKSISLSSVIFFSLLCMTSCAHSSAEVPVTKTEQSKAESSNAVSDDFIKLIQDAKMSPFLENGEFKGHVLTQIRRDGIYEKVGIQDGDVLESINGEKLSDADAAIRTLNSLRRNQTAVLTIKRQGVLIQKQIQLR